ncbi:MAG: glycosyltransferase [Candidatus Melainabacteria bacterium]|nr:glycosyltransferase [Candidatus Melainabacteria bacterium]
MAPHPDGPMDKPVSPIQVAFTNRNDCLIRPGGDTVQLQQTRHYLEQAYPVQTRLCQEPAELETFATLDLVHIFNVGMIDAALSALALAQKRKLPVALTPIHWDHRDAIYVAWLAHRLRLAVPAPWMRPVQPWFYRLEYWRHRLTGSQKALYRNPKFNAACQKLLNECDLLLPNSDEELAQLSEHFEVDLNTLKAKTVVVPNALDRTLSQSYNGQTHTARTALPEALNGVSNFVLQVGRVEPRKNQAALIQALWQERQIPIVLVGSAYSDKYAQVIRTMAAQRGNVYWLPEVAHEAVYNLYRHARVHVLPSFVESPGLVSLEALACGCEVVVSGHPYTPLRYYQLDQVAHVCDPYSPKSIRKAILAAFDQPKAQPLPPGYLEQYSYERVAALTWKGYQQLLQPAHPERVPQAHARTHQQH